METKNNNQTVVSDNRVNNKLNFEVMTLENEKVATSNANETINATKVASVEPQKSNSMEEYPTLETENATEVASVEPQNNGMNGKTNQTDTDCCPKEKTTAIAIIDGVKREIKLGRTIYSMDVLKKSQEKLLEEIDKSKLLDEIFHFADPEIFRKAGITLYDCEGKEIPGDEENVLVPIETGANYWRFGFDDVLKHVQVHAFESVEEYAQVVGMADLFTRSRSTVEKIGIAALATGDATYNAVYELARKTGMPGSAAYAYLGVQLKGSATVEMSIGINRKDVPVPNRTLEDALELHKQICLTFTPADARKRYVIRAVNSVMKTGDYDLATIMQALRTIPAESVTRARLMDCGAKEACIASVLVRYIVEMRQKAAA